MKYKAIVGFQNGDISEATGSPELNVVVTSANNQLVFTHPCIKETSNVQATLCDILDDEVCIAFNPNTGQASLQVLNAALQVRTQYRVSVSIEF